MSVPVPVTITIKQPPVGWTAQSPNLFKELATLAASLLSGTITASFLTGQIGGPAPTSDIGPWQNGNEWWFWDPSTHQYWPSQQGAPIGSIMMWGVGNLATVPPRWLACQGQKLNVATYPRLYAAIGNTWGSRPGTGIFFLPPPAVAFLNAPNWYQPPTDIHYDPSHSPDGLVNLRGGWQVQTIAANNLPAAKISIPFVNTQMVTGSNNQPNIQLTGSSYLYPVTDESGNPIGNQQQNISVMPPFVVVYYVIKYM